MAVALRARLTLVSTAGSRILEAGEFFRDDGIDYLTRRPDEIMSSIDVPLHTGWRMTYQKLRRRGSFDFPILGVAAAARVVDGVVEDVRLVLETALECAAPMPVASVIRDQFVSAMANGQADQDWSSVVRTAARAAGL